MSKKHFKASRLASAGAGLFFSVCLFILGASAALADIAGHVVVNEVHVDSISGAGGTDDDWVELYNPTAAEVSLAGWSIQKASGSGGNVFSQPLSGTISAGGYFLIVRDGAATSQSLKDTADLLASDDFSIANNNIVYLVNNQTVISNNLTDPDIIDFVGFGTAVYFEGIAAAPGISEAKSISRIPEGEDTDQNSADFVLCSRPTPQHSVSADATSLNGQVLLTVAADAVPVQNISANGADIVFSVNSAGSAKVRYGFDPAYGSETSLSAVGENIPARISLTGLQCDKEYHYSIYAENDEGTENDATIDAMFITLPCGLAVDSLNMTRTQAKANNQYSDGWEWEFNLTVWNMAETKLKMKFNAWTGPGSIDAGGNLEYSADNGANWTAIADSGAYPAVGADISAIDNGPAVGRQVKVIVRMKVPQGTPAGFYDSSYGILTEL